jgi:hypothetical protein
MNGPGSRSLPDARLLRLILWLKGFYLLRRSHPQTRTAALLAAPLFVVDGWFDVLTASSRGDMAVSMAMLGLAELPVAIFLILLARRAREYEKNPIWLSRRPG